MIIKNSMHTSNIGADSTVTSEHGNGHDGNKVTLIKLWQGY